MVIIGLTALTVLTSHCCMSRAMLQLFDPKISDGGNTEGLEGVSFVLAMKKRRQKSGQ